MIASFGATTFSRMTLSKMQLKRHDDTQQCAIHNNDTEQNKTHHNDTQQNETHRNDVQMI